MDIVAEAPFNKMTQSAALFSALALHELMFTAFLEREDERYIIKCDEYMRIRIQYYAAAYVG